MTERLPPALALRYLHELSTDVQAGVVVDAAGALLAGDAPLHAAARQLLASVAAGEEGAVAQAPRTTILALRDDLHGVAVACGRHVVPALAHHDLRTVLEALRTDAAAPDLAPDGGSPVRPSGT
jgi:hypothetical protein